MTIADDDDGYDDHLSSTMFIFSLQYIMFYLDMPDARWLWSGCVATTQKE